MTEERLQKILSNSGVSSRRVAEELILAGRISVNGTVTNTLGARADPDTDDITVDGVPVVRERYRYFMLNKPAGFVTTVDDELDRETVSISSPSAISRSIPSAAWIRDSEGLLILTNDGHLTDLLTHPRYEVEKDYLVGLDSMPSQRDVQRLVRGVESEGERLRATSVQPAAAPEPALGEPAQGAASWIILTLKEGRTARSAACSPRWAATSSSFGVYASGHSTSRRSAPVHFANSPRRKLTVSTRPRRVRRRDPFPHHRHAPNAAPSPALASRLPRQAAGSPGGHDDRTTSHRHRRPGCLRQVHPRRAPSPIILASLSSIPG